MAKLYTLKSGKINRRNHEGEYEIHKAPFTFVPSPSEFESEKFRLEIAGDVADDSNEVLAALFNTNLQVYPGAFAGSPWRKKDADIAKQKQPVSTGPNIKQVSPQPPTDVREFKSASEAVRYIQTNTFTKEQLEEALKQEAKNAPVARKSVIKAIQDKLADSKAGDTAKAATADGVPASVTDNE